MKLSEHFSLDEFTTSQTAARRRIDNTPTPAVFANLKRIAALLEQVRAIYGKPLTISSGYRSPELNAAIGGAKASAHVLGLAADINVPGVSPAVLAREIIKAGIKFDQLIYEGTWVHIALRAGVSRNEVLTAHFGADGRATYTSGLA
ncbi:MAG: D-Ala-D-Ala carboxypeptidase family metallohydrolase [Pseudomonadota bacterium]